MSVCRQDRIWELTKDDMYCSWCGKELKSIEATLVPDCLFIDFPSRYSVKGEKISLQLIIKNKGQLPVRILDIDDSDKSWLQVSRDDYKNYRIQPKGPPLIIDLDVDLASPPNEYAETEIHITADDCRDPITLLFKLFPKPQFQVVMNRHSILMDDGEKEIAGTVKITTGAARVERLHADVEWAYVPGDSLPLTLDSHVPGDDTLSFKVIVDSGSLRKNIRENSVKRPPYAEVFLLISCGEPALESRVKIALPLQWPPELYVHGLEKGRIEKKVLLGRWREISLQIENQGHTDLVMSEIRFDPDHDRLKLRPDVWGKQDSRSIKAGAMDKIVFYMNARDLVEGVYDTSIIIHSNSYPHEKMRIPLRIRAEEVVVFDGWVAIDFGTTNSCCAIMPQMASNPKIMDIDKFSIDPPSIPSVILYERLEPWKKLYSIGGYARSYFRVPECRESIVLSIKRRLGERPPRYQPQDIIFYENGERTSYWPHEMAADIIEQMIRLVEEDLRKKVDKCFITYPARFSPIQLAALEEACKICNIDIIAMYPESVAAAFDAILREEDVNTKKKATQDPYTLMVYDFGGGSIDIAFLHVNAHRDDEMGTDRFSITVLGTDGKRRFGGDDITWLILEKTLIHPTAQKKGLTDAEYKKIINDTLPHLWEEFEEIKRKLTSVKCTDQKNDETILETLKIDKKLYLPGNGKRVEEEIDCTIRRDEVNKIVTDGIKESICMMERLFEKSKKCFPDHVVGDFPDVILLAGKSCRMKVVEEIIKEKFSQKGKGSTVIKAKELKECVTKGAVRLGMLQNTPGLVDVEIQGALHTATAKVGIISAYGLGTRKFTPVIQMGDPIGEWVPLPQKIRLRSRHTLITVAENTGMSDLLEINEAPNPEIELVGTYQLSDHIPADLKDSELRDAKLEMILTDKHEIVMKITLRSEDYFLTAHRPILG